MHRLDSLPNWPPVNFDGEFDALGVDVRAMAPATAGETETPRTSFPDVPDVWLAMDQDVFGSPFHGEGTFQSEHFGAPLGGLGDFATGEISFATARNRLSQVKSIIASLIARITIRPYVDHE